jgi:2-polyprenyl-6-methoxyphenol hydroxylase-like FAD-dependent oxidoreductase
MQPRPKRRAIVVGGSIAGLFTAAFLRRIGWQVEVYERSSIELIGRGVGIFATHLELFEALDKCGAGTVDMKSRTKAGSSKKRASTSHNSLPI